MSLWALQRSEHGWEDIYLGQCGLKRRYHRRGDTQSEIAALTKINGYYNVGISDLEGHFKTEKTKSAAIKASSGHGLGIVTDNASGVHLFFDPNWGFGLFPSADKLSLFLLKYWEFQYSDLTGNTVLSRCS